MHYFFQDSALYIKKDYENISNDVFFVVRFSSGERMSTVFNNPPSANLNVCEHM